MKVYNDELEGDGNAKNVMCISNRNGLTNE